MTTDKERRPLQRWEIVIALIALIGALMFNAWQTRVETEAVRLQTVALDAQRKAYEAQTWQMINQQTMETSKVLIENPRIVPYFTRGKYIDPKHRDYNLVMIVAELYLDFIDGFDDEYVRSLAGMGKDGENWRLWENYFQDAFAQSPAMCIRLAETKDWYSPSTGKYAEKGCSVNAAYQAHLKASSQTSAAHPARTHGGKPIEVTKKGER
ncbi:MAG: hypothetical protein KA801_02160 [Syntrophorhabdaceae bacterium]|nr:hypothetical protein [Syntrophorhabdaceae bacterium]